MAISKSSFGLTSAKKAGAATSKAIRRLFGRVLPGGGPEGAAGSRSITGSSSLDSNNLSGVSDLNNNTKSLNNRGENEVKDNKDQDKDASPVSKTQVLDEQRPPLASKVSTNDTPINTTRQDNSIGRKPADNMVVDSAKSVNKENQPPQATALAESLGGLTLKEKDAKPALEEPTPEPTTLPVDEDPEVVAERQKNLRFIGEALDMARLALRTNETPVGCVLVHNDKVIARGMNATNVTRNGTRHAEFMALSALLSYPPKEGLRTKCLKPKPENPPSDAESVASRDPEEGNEDGKRGHLWPYGQKDHPAERVDRSIIRESILYVTVEPCVMCASLLRQLGIKKVYFGAVNDKFGGTGGVFSLHANSLPISADGQTAAAHPTPRPTQLPDGSGTLGVSFPPGGGDGGNIEPGYEIEGGWGRDEAVSLLRQFYVQENGRAPVPRKKEGRAARLQAMMEQDGELSPEDAALAAAAGLKIGDKSLSKDDQKENIDPLVTETAAPLPTSPKALDENVDGQNTNESLVR